MRNPNSYILCPFLLLLSAFAQEVPPAAVEGVKGVRQEGAGKVREVEPAATQVAPTPVPPPPSQVVKGVAAKAVENPNSKSVPLPSGQGMKPVEGQKPPESVQGPGMKAVAPPETKATPPPVAQGVREIEGQKPPKPVGGAGKGVPPPPSVKSVAPPSPGSVTPPPTGVKPPTGIKPVRGVAGIDADKQRNLEAALQAKPLGGPDAKKAKAAAALLEGPPAKPKTADKADDRRLFEEARKIPDNGS